MSILTAEYWPTVLRACAVIPVSTHCWWRFPASGAEFVHHAARCMICLSPTKRAVKFAEHLHENVLEDVPNRHVVLTIPKRLRGYFRYDRKLKHRALSGGVGAHRYGAWLRGCGPRRSAHNSDRRLGVELPPRLRQGFVGASHPIRSRYSFSESGRTCTAPLLTEYSIPTANFKKEKFRRGPTLNSLNLLDLFILSSS